LNRHRAASLTLVAIVALLALIFVPSASALTQRPFKETFGSAEQPSFGWVSTMAVEKDSGNVIVGERFGSPTTGSVPALIRYHADGTPAPFAALGTNFIDGREANGKPCAEEPASCDQTPQNELDLGNVTSQIAIDESGGPTDGNIYLSQSGTLGQPATSFVDIFSAGGEYLGQLAKAGVANFDGQVTGVAVDETGAVYVSAGEVIYKYAPSGDLPVNTDLTDTFELSFSQPSILALGSGPSAGSLFVARPQGTVSEARVFEIDKETGETKYEFAEGYGFGSLAVDPNSGNVLTGRGQSNEIGEFEATGDAKPVKVGRLVYSGNQNVFAVNGSSEAIATHGITALDVYGTPAPVPVLTISPAGEVTGTKATLSGTVNPGGLPVTECYFEYDGTKAPCAESPASIGEGNSPVPVHVNLSGLEPNGHSYTFRLVAVNANGFEQTEFHEFTTAETVVVEAAGPIGPETATLNGTVRPEGDQYTACFFEYGLSTSAGFEKTVPCEPGAAGIPSDYFPHAVKAPLTGLQSGLTYRYRLVATNSSGTIKTEELTFSTTGQPRIGEVRASAATQNAVTLEAMINPSGFGTSYRIEWGPTIAYGNVTPAEFEPFIGSGTELVQVKSRLSGLAAGSSYHYRVVATSSRGVVQSADHLAETLNSCGLPEGRCFEIVSRRDAGPIAIPGENNAAIEMHYQAATGGAGGLAYPVEGGYPEATKGADVQYRALRTPSGWASTQLSPPILAQNERGDVGAVSSSTQWLSDDLSCGFTESWQPLTADPSMKLVRELGGSNLYRINPDGSYTGVSSLAPEIVAGSAPEGYKVADASRDCGKVVFSSKLTYSGIPGAGLSRLYEWDEGTLRNVGVVPGPGGEEVVVEARAGGEASVVTQNFTNTVSEDGSRVFFTAQRQTSPNPAEIGAEAIFVRENGTVTRDLSLSQTSTPAGNALYQWATPDGSKVFFTANAGLTDESNAEGTDLYEYDLETEELTDRSVTTAEGGAEVTGFLAASADGSQVYFAARNQLIPGSGNSRAQNVKANTYSIYGERDGELSFVGTFSQKERLAVLLEAEEAWVSQASPDGRYLLFESSAKVTGYDSAGLREAYLYDADAGTTTCVSCRQDGQPSEDNRYGTPGYTILPRSNPLQSPLHPPRFLTVRNGEPQVFFSSPDSLAPGAVPGQNNIYEWSHDQVFRLVSSNEGTQASGHLTPGFFAVFGGASDDGSDVYLITPETINWEDGDERQSAYDARIGGGFPQPPAPPAPCTATVEGSCQGTAQGGPAIPGAASTTFTGPGDPKQAQAKKKKKKAHKKKAHKKKHKKSKGKKARHANGNGRTGK